MYLAVCSCISSLNAGAYIRSGLGRSPWSTANVLTGPLGEGPGRYQEGVVVRVVSLGNNVLESPCASHASVIGRVSVADASLSLSLSLLWDSSPSPLRPTLAGRPGSPKGGLGRAGCLGARPPHRGNSPRPAGYKARLCHSRAIGASTASCSSAAVGSVPVAILCCPGSSGGRVFGYSRRGWV